MVNTEVKLQGSKDRKNRNDLIEVNTEIKMKEENIGR